MPIVVWFKYSQLGNSRNKFAKGLVFYGYKITLSRLLMLYYYHLNQLFRYGDPELGVVALIPALRRQEPEARGSL